MRSSLKHWSLAEYGIVPKYKQVHKQRIRSDQNCFLDVPSRSMQGIGSRSRGTVSLDKAAGTCDMCDRIHLMQERLRHNVILSKTIVAFCLEVVRKCRHPLFLE